MRPRRPQAIMQKLRQFEKERIYDDFKDPSVTSFPGSCAAERSDLFIDLARPKP